MKSLILLRGAPGAGKSTFAKIISEYNVEADQFHYVDGVYAWRRSNLKRAHHLCKLQTKEWMKEEKETIVVSNTFSTKKEMEPYYELAKDYDYMVISTVVENRHGGKNVHDVPAETVERMKSNIINNIQL